MPLSVSEAFVDNGVVRPEVGASDNEKAPPSFYFFGAGGLGGKEN